MRVNITLEHKESGERLYLTSKNKRNTPDRLQIRVQYESIQKKNADFKRFFFLQNAVYCTVFQFKLYLLLYLF